MCFRICTRLYLNGIVGTKDNCPLFIIRQRPEMQLHNIDKQPDGYNSNGATFVFAVMSSWPDVTFFGLCHWPCVPCPSLRKPPPWDDVAWMAGEQVSRMEEVCYAPYLTSARTVRYATRWRRAARSRLTWHNAHHKQLAINNIFYLYFSDLGQVSVTVFLVFIPLM